MKRAIQEGTIASIPLIAFLFGFFLIKVSLRTIFPLIIIYAVFLIVLFHHHKDRIKK